VVTGLAAGDFSLRAVHETLGSDDVTIKLAVGACVHVTFVLGAERKVSITRDGMPAANQIVKVAHANLELMATTNENGEITVPTSWFATAIVWSLSDTGAWVECDVVSTSGVLLVVAIRS